MVSPLGNIRMEVIACDFCGSQKSTFLIAAKDRLSNGGVFQVVRCEECGLILTNPRPVEEDILAFYPDNFVSWQTTPQTPKELRLRLEDLMYNLARKGGLFSKGLYHGLRYIYPMISKIPLEPGRLLDIGCGTGHYLDHMKKLGWEVKGIDISATACRLARTYYGLEVFNGTLEQANLPAEYFDLVTMIGVLEHLHHPMKTLEEVYRILRPGGVVAIAVPNIDSWGAKFFKEHWWVLELPRHLYHFSPQILKRYLYKTGFKVELLRFGVQTWMLNVNFQTLLSEKYGLKLFQKRLPDFIFTPFAILLALLKKSDAMIIFARKRDI